MLVGGHYGDVENFALGHHCARRVGEHRSRKAVARGAGVARLPYATSVQNGYQTGYQNKQIQANTARASFQKALENRNIVDG